MSEINDAISPEDKPKAECPKQTGTEEQKWFERYKSIPPFFTALFAFISIFITLYFSSKLAGNAEKSANAAEQSAINAKKSIDLAEKAMRMSNRPYIVVSSAKVVSFVDWNNVNILVITKNFGRTPAMKIQISARINCFANEFTENPPFEVRVDTVKSLGFIGSEMPIHINLKNHIKFSNDEILKLNERKLFLFAYGVIKYTDIFDDTLVTKFNFKYNGKSLDVHPKYNDVK